ncbi:MAG: glutamyl-tRNA reductase [Waddliaceae bacterium]|nr:glutamyl-tRNA reductase [Waddliaceae bacterium]
MQVGIIGLNHKSAKLELREEFAAQCERRLADLMPSTLLSPFVLLSTCNRTELYFSADCLEIAQREFLDFLCSGLSDSVIDHIYSYLGIPCFHHLARVVSGLDSAVQAETEIQGQVKQAYLTASQERDLGSELHHIFQKSLRVGKKVRTELDFSRGYFDVQKAVSVLGEEHFECLTRPKILLVGLSEINQKVVHHLRNRGAQSLTICNRTDTRAKAFADEMDMSVLPWEEFHRWHEWDWVIFATKASHFLVRDQGHPIQSSLLVDLSVPRNVHPGLGELNGLSLVNIDQINCLIEERKADSSQGLRLAEQMVSEDVERHSKGFLEKRRSLAIQASGT